MNTRSSNLRHRLLTVGIFVRSIPHHRRRFYEILREELAASGVELRLYAGHLRARAASKKDTIQIEWATEVDNRTIRLGSRELYYQACLREAMSVDLAIVIQESKLILNYLLAALRPFGFVKLAYWGHGKSFKMESASRYGEFVKRLMSRHVDWWFAYNSKSRGIVEGLGYPAARITVVDNAIDTRHLIKLKNEISPQELSELSRELALDSSNVCLYAGSLYKEKQIGLLLASLAQVKNQIPDFKMLVVGAGPESAEVENFSKAHPWLIYLGPKYDRELVAIFGLAKLLLIPGAVGLSALDSFALETPLVTTEDQAHGPEIAYLESGKNAWIVAGGDDPERYAAQVVRLLKDNGLRDELVAGCQLAAGIYTIEKMVANFRDGILAALGIEPTHHKIS